jgi:6-pyruvoyltetrahydropterin/6-carboxytetrahydropterin synthase
MLRVTKIFRFETAHAIYGYAGSCKNIHGHSYVLHVTVQSADHDDDFLPAPGFVIDFKELKKLVNTYVVDRFDHRIILSEQYLAMHPHLSELENMEIWPMEPTAENILLDVRNNLASKLPSSVKLSNLKLYETADSYAEWTPGL